MDAAGCHSFELAVKAVEQMETGRKLAKRRRQNELFQDFAHTSNGDIFAKQDTIEMKPCLQKVCVHSCCMKRSGEGRGGGKVHDSL